MVDYGLKDKNGADRYFKANEQARMITSQVIKVSGGHAL